ncbi:ATP-grasp domain-containing protein [Paraherbaspirillum soli]|uniref:Acetyl-CoA carboxylase biotin carboxylase subunit family protein n=1 Tax=Paraherbaspirillum soli TaxID=631222 RepID=A0ABW0ME92_9BURK
MKEILVLHPVAEYTLRRMLDMCDRRGWKLSIITIESSTVGGDGKRLHRWLRVRELSDDPADLLRSVKGMDIDAVVPGNEFAVIAADILAKELGLPGNDPQAIQASRNKRLMRNAFEAAYVPQPKVIGTLSSIEEARVFDWSRVRFPVIVKPINMAMSLFVRLCHTPDEVLENLERMFLFKKSKLTNYAFTLQAIVEEFADGQEYSLECIVEGGEVIAMYPTRKFVPPFPSCFEIGHVNAEIFDSAQRERLLDVAQRVALSWKLVAGVMHVELKIGVSGIKVIEAGCRIAGDHISELVEGRYGVSFEEVLLCQRAGLGVRNLVTTPVSGDYYGIKFLFPQTRLLHPISDLREVQYHFSLDQNVSGDAWSVNQRLGYCMCASSDYSRLCEFVGSA